MRVHNIGKIEMKIKNTLKMRETSSRKDSPLEFPTDTMETEIAEIEVARKEMHLRIHSSQVRLSNTSIMPDFDVLCNKATASRPHEEEVEEEEEGSNIYLSHF